MKFGLGIDAIKKIQTVLKKHPEIKGAQIFGSRALGTYKYNSDIDLALWGSIPERLLAAVNAELDDLPFPYKFDVVVYEDINHADLREHISKYGQDILDI